MKRYKEALLALPAYVAVVPLFYFFVIGNFIAWPCIGFFLFIYIAIIAPRWINARTFPIRLIVALALGLLPPWLFGVAWGLYAAGDEDDKQDSFNWFLAGVISEWFWGTTTIVLWLRRGKAEAHRRPLLASPAKPELVVETAIEVTCSVCLQRPKSVLLLPCRHLCLCPQCSAELPKAVCPLCRSEVQDRIETFV